MTVALHGAKREGAVALAGYGLLVVLSLLCGYRMSVHPYYYQLLGLDHLANRLLESLLYLHAQPPMLNLGLGAALKLERVTGLPFEGLLLLLHVGLGALGVIAFTRLCQAFLPGRTPRRICIALFVAHPVFYMTLFHYFYTFHEVVLLCWISLALLQFLELRTGRCYALLCSLVVLLVYTRSLFHWAWAGAVLIGALVAIRRSEEASPRIGRAHVLCLSAALFALLLWPAKNQLLFDSFAYTSWFGYNLAQQLPSVERPERDWSVPEEYRDIPVLAEREKPDQSKNWNHYSIIRYSRELGRRAVEAINEDPTALFDKLRLNYWNYTRFSGRNSYTGKFGVGGTDAPSAAHPWLRAYELVLYQDFRGPVALAHRAFRSSGTQSWALSGFTLTFPFLLGFVAWRLRREWPLQRSVGLTAVFMFATLGWVFGLTLVVDGAEANRIRFSTEPYLLLLCVWAMASFGSRRGARAG